MKKLAPLALAVALLAPSCTLIKPVTCAVVHPVVSVIDLFERASRHDDSDEEYASMPTGLALVELTLLLPVYYTYKTAVGAVGGLFTGFVSDLNVITGNADYDATIATIADPTHVNQRRKK